MNWASTAWEVQWWTLGTPTAWEVRGGGGIRNTHCMRGTVTDNRNPVLKKSNDWGACVCVCCVHLCVHLWMCDICLSTHVETKGQSSVSFPIVIYCFFFFFFSLESSLTSLELEEQVLLAGQSRATQESSLSLPPQHYNYKHTLQYLASFAQVLGVSPRWSSTPLTEPLPRPTWCLSLRNVVFWKGKEMKPIPWALQNRWNDYRQQVVLWKE